MRWIVSCAFVVFALFALGALATNRGSTPTPSASATPTTQGVAVQPSATPSPALPTRAAPTLTARPGQPTTVAGGTPTPAAPAADLLVMVNKQSPLPASYVPPDLVTLTTVHTLTSGQKARRAIVPSIEKLMADAKAAGFDLAVSSAYRSYGEQESVHAYWERTLGKAEADRVSALAGYSEHQLGTVIDLTSASVGFELEEKFGTTPEGKWLRANAYRYGFVISYPEGKEAVTGYAYEPWHFRYVGVEAATAVYQKGITLDEYLRSRR